MIQAIRNIVMAAAIGAIAGTAQIPPEVSEARCEGKTTGAACWKKLANHPECYFWAEELPYPKRKATWTGECRSGLAHGEGSLDWSSDPPPEEGRVHYGRSLLFKRGELKDGKKRGKWTVGGFNGIHGYQLKGSYVKGKKHGQWVEDFGTFREEGPYVQGKRHGRWVEYDVPGNASIGKGRYVRGKKHGRWVTRKNGRITHEGMYVAGKQHGYWVENYGFPRQMTKGRYVNGEKHGKWILWMERWSSNKIDVEVRIYEHGQFIRTVRQWTELRRKNR